MFSVHQWDCRPDGCGLCGRPGLGKGRGVIPFPWYTAGGGGGRARETWFGRYDFCSEQALRQVATHLERGRSGEVQRRQWREKRGGEVKVESGFQVRRQKLQLFSGAGLHHVAHKYPPLPCVPRSEAEQDGF